ncbi:MAG: hypothetical protein RLZZ77_331 [Bacteroidota bacterium]
MPFFLLRAGRKMFVFVPMSSRLILTFFIVHNAGTLGAQPGPVSSLDSIFHLKPIQIFVYPEGFVVGEEFRKDLLVSGKKVDHIQISKSDFSPTERAGRQLFARVAGLFVYDMDGSGNQMNISTRGLDPHRSWEFNVRKDGIMTNTDIFGYPASHYNIPMEAVDYVQLVRGTGSIQYGAQFGGMINYVTKSPCTNRKIDYSMMQSYGSFNAWSTFHRLHGTIGKWRYSAWLQRKGTQGYRDNSKSTGGAEEVAVWYKPNEKFELKIDWTRSTYQAQIPGQLTDSLFRLDPTQSSRSRNHYSPTIYIPSVRVDYRKNEHWRFSGTAAFLFGQRNSVLFDRAANIVDAIDTLTGQYANRQVDRDFYQSFTTEWKAIYTTSQWKRPMNIVFGAQYIHNHLHRRQQGKGTTGSDYDLTLVEPEYGRDIYFKSRNIALFIEEAWKLGSRLTWTVGARYENGESNMTGRIKYLEDEKVPVTIEHQFPLLASGFAYRLNQHSELYGGWSQAYRPVIFKDIIPASVYEFTNPNLKDAKGYNAELGYRGSFDHWQIELTAFQLMYRNRLGILVETDSLDQLYLYRTNIGDSRTRGVEFFAQYSRSLKENVYWVSMVSGSYMDSRYVNANVRSGTENVNIDGRFVESTPQWIVRAATELNHTSFGVKVLYSFVDQSFADALNTVTPNASASVGLVPAYQLVDLSAHYMINRWFKVQASVSNIFDEQYFTKRPQFYPGPGVWPSDGRTFSVAVAYNL